MANFGDFLCTVFSASHVQHVSDLHPKFALRPHHVWKYGRHPTAEIRRGKKEIKEKRQDENIMACPIPKGGHNNDSKKCKLERQRNRVYRRAVSWRMTIQCNIIISFDLTHSFASGWIMNATGAGKVLLVFLSCINVQFHVSWNHLLFTKHTNLPYNRLLLGSVFQ